MVDNRPIDADWLVNDRRIVMADVIKRVIVIVPVRLRHRVAPYQDALVLLFIELMRLPLKAVLNPPRRVLPIGANIHIGQSLLLVLRRMRVLVLSFR